MCALHSLVELTELNGISYFSTHFPLPLSSSFLNIFPIASPSVECHVIPGYCTRKKTGSRDSQYEINVSCLQVGNMCADGILNKTKLPTPALFSGVSERMKPLCK